MLTSFAINQAFCNLCDHCVFSRWLFGMAIGLSFIIITALPSDSVAQFPGVGRAAPDGVATSSGDGGYNSEGADAGDSDIDDGSFGGNEAVSNGAGVVSVQSDDQNYGDSNQIINSKVPSSVLINKQHRKQLFVQKLRLEFASIKLFERKTGLPFSRDDVPRFLNELRGDLKKIATLEQKGAIVEGTVQSIARDAYHIETELNQHLEQLIEQLGQSVPRKHFFAMEPALPKTSRAVGEKLDTIALKFELADYGKKVLQAMGAKTY